MLEQMELSATRTGSQELAQHLRSRWCVLEREASIWSSLPSVCRAMQF